MGDWQIVRRALEVAGSVWPTSESEEVWAGMEALERLEARCARWEPTIVEVEGVLDEGAAKRLRIVTFVARYWKEHGIAPTLREICDGADISSTSVANKQIGILEEMGQVTRRRGIPRSLRLVKQAGPVSVAEVWDRS